MSIDDTLWALLPLGIILVGLLTLWSASWVRYRGTVANSFAASIMPNVIGWSLLLIGFFVTSFAINFVFAPLVCLATAVIFVRAVLRYWRSEVQFLIWTLSEAALRGIPLESAARAFASERHGLMAARARSLADYLDAAMPLSLAMTRSGLKASPEIRLAADIGEKTGTLGQSLRRAIQQANEYDRVLGSIVVKFVYFSSLIGVIVFVLTFLMIKIMPIFSEMFREFGLKLPAVTELVISISRAFVDYWYLLIPFMALLAVGMTLWLLYFLGISFRSMPIVGWLFSPIDNTSVLQMLAVAVKENRPVVDTLELLTAYAPPSRSRRLLHLAVRQIADGTHWCDALQRAHLVTRAQSAVFKSAERTGNLAWALAEMADTTVRRSAQRLQAAQGVLFPVALLGIGFCVMLVAAGILAPLFSLISKLA